MKIFGIFLRLEKYAWDICKYLKFINSFDLFFRSFYKIFFKKQNDFENFFERDIF